VHAIADDRFISRLTSMVQSNPEYDKLMQGCFENYTAMQFNDSQLTKCVVIGDWMEFYDMLMLRMNAHQQYDLLAYVPYALIAFHPLFAGSISQRIAFPKSDYEVCV
jgi:chromosome transmission fidelity protein 18